MTIEDKKHQKTDELICQYVLRQAEEDLLEFEKECGIEIPMSPNGVFETWINTWRNNDIFKGFVLSKQKGIKKLSRRIIINGHHMKNTGSLVLHLRSKRKGKFRMPIKVRRKIRSFIEVKKRRKIK